MDQDKTVKCMRLENIALYGIPYSRYFSLDSWKLSDLYYSPV